MASISLRAPTAPNSASWTRRGWCLAEFHERASKELPNYPGDDRVRWRTYWSNSVSYKDAADFEHLLDGPGKPGLPV